MNDIANAMQSKRQAAVPFILICVLLDVLGFGLIIPVLPSLVGEFTGARDAQAYRYGVLTAVYGVMQFTCAPLLGALSDRYGRRPVMLFAIAGLGLDFLLMAVAPSLGWLLVARIIGGATAANFSVASAYIAYVTAPSERLARRGAVFCERCFASDLARHRDPALSFASHQAVGVGRCERCDCRGFKNHRSLTHAHA